MFENTALTPGFSGQASIAEIQKIVGSTDDNGGGENLSLYPE